MAPHIRTVKTASGARAVQIVHSKKGGKRELEHVGSAHTDAEYELLVAAARKKMAGGQGELDLGLESESTGTLEIASTRTSALIEAIQSLHWGLLKDGPIDVKRRGDQS